jgi:hypothetical protein
VTKGQRNSAQTYQLYADLRGNNTSLLSVMNVFKIQLSQRAAYTAFRLHRAGIMFMFYSYRFPRPDHCLVRRVFDVHLEPCTSLILISISSAIAPGL